jgi:hypothetical protein
MLLSHSPLYHVKVYCTSTPQPSLCLPPFCETRSAKDKLNSHLSDRDNAEKGHASIVFASSHKDCELGLEAPRHK